MNFLNLYNINFDISALLIYSMVIVSYIQRKHVNNTQHKLFIYMFVCSVLTPVTDIIASLLIEYKAPYLPTMLANTIYYLTKEGTTFFYLLYIISQLEMRTHMPLIKEAAISLPCLLITAVILINPLTGWMFTYKDFEYQSHNMRYLLYCTNIFYYYWAVIFVYKNKKWFNKNFPRLIHTISIFCVAAELIQLIFPALLIHSLSCALMMLILVMNLERYGMVIDPITGFAKKEHLEKTCDKYFYNDQPFKSMLIKMSDFDLLTLNYGSENVDLMTQEMEKYLLTYVAKGRAFHLASGTVVLLFSYETDTSPLEKEIYTGLTKPWLINNLEMVSDIYITTITCPEQVKNIVSYVAMLQYFEKLQRPHAGIFSSEEMHFADKVREQQVIKAIEDGLKDGNFSMYYQPICTAKDRKFVSAEALIRLKDPVMGFIPPSEFIPIAEQSGTILDIGYFVVDQVCDFIEHHDMKQLGLDYIELNLSTIQCLQHNFIDVIDEITSRHHVDSSKLCFEITETASNYAPSVFADNLKRLDEKGYMLALDDFGTGYGNLQRMVTSDFHLIKLDKEMTQRLSSEIQLKKTYIRLASMINGMGSRIVSEGVETKEQYEFVRDAGSYYIQGYFFSKPLPADEFIDFLVNVQDLYPVAEN